MSLPLILLLTLLALTSLVPSTTARLSSPLLRSLLPSPSPLPPSPSAVTASSCSIPSDWQHPLNASQDVVPGLPILFPGPCLLVGYVFDAVKGGGLLVGIDVATGATRWSVEATGAQGLPLGPYSSFLFNQTTGTMYLSNRNVVDGGVSFCEVTQGGVASADGSAFKWQWSVSVCYNHSFVDGVEPTLLLFPRGQGQTLLLSIGGWDDVLGGGASNITWTTIDASSGRVLQQQINQSGFDDVAVRGDPALGYFLVDLQRSSSLFQLQDGGSWQLVKQLPSRSDFELIIEPRGLTDLHLNDTVLSGTDLRTGQQAWRLDNDSLVTGAWAADFSGYDAFPPNFLQHPTEANLVLRNAWALNGGGEALFLADVFDVVSGKTVVAMAHPELFSSNLGGEQLEPGLQLVDGAVVYHLVLDSGPQWLALDAQTLKVVSTGEFEAEDETWVAVNATHASLIDQQLKPTTSLVGLTLRANVTNTDSAGSEAPASTGWERLRRTWRQ